MSVKEKTKAALEADQKLQKYEMQTYSSTSGVTATLILILILVTSVSFGSYLAVKSLWDFTNPELNITFPNPSVLAAIAEDAELPDVSNIFGALPDIKVGGYSLPTEDIQSFFDSVKESTVGFMDKVPRSDIAAYGAAICEQINSGVSPENVVLQFQKQLLEDYPGLAGADAFAQDLVDKATTTLCPVTE